MILHEFACAQAAVNWAAEEVAAFSCKAVHIACRKVRLPDDSQAVAPILPTA